MKKLELKQSILQNQQEHQHSFQNAKIVIIDYEILPKQWGKL